MTVKSPFMPSYGKGVTVTASSSSAFANLGNGSKTLCLTNTGSDIVYVRCSASASDAASSSDYIIPTSAQVTIGKDQDQNYLYYISPTSTTLNIIPGEGF